MNDDSVIGNHHLNSFGIRLGKFPALFEGMLNAWEMKFFQALFFLLFFGAPMVSIVDFHFWNQIDLIVPELAEVIVAL